MASYLSSGTIAALASVFALVPLAIETGNETPLKNVEQAGPAIPAAKPTFPEPKLRTLELPLTEPFIGFKDTLNPATMADDGGAERMTEIALATVWTEPSPSAPPSPSSAVAELERPVFASAQRPGRHQPGSRLPHDRRGHRRPVGAPGRLQH